ncbi:hypothetical protein [Janibacter melonis]|uniref:hypothetical protein n=1 Tax=Janibacter melonis TaxID=262209 RepID=UPI0017498553|nr:hypothetical protein [Janibacter melonis]
MSTTDHSTDRPTHNGWGICEGCGAFVDPAELYEAGTCTRCQAAPPSTNQTSQTSAKGVAPVLRPGVLYFAHDRIVCATIRCAGSCALFTGVTTGGAVLSPVTDDDAAQWQTYGLGPMTCECTALTYAE